jgi:2-succinyl-5-enolpyruvyl-6-hydroxy-3-cyclohexene-1-carboxylate synthase
MASRMADNPGVNRPDDIACLNLHWALALLDGLLVGGVAHLVLSPGSRSTPVVLAAQRQAEARSGPGLGLTLTPVLDERSAAFFALGLARASRRPVVLLCTSGSASGHWLPAVIEASEWGVPLILLTADRPPQLRGWGSNQTIDQTRLFGPFAREFHDPGPPQPGPAALKAMRALGRRAATVALGPRPGPVHINLPFPEPLVPTAECDAHPQTPSAPAPISEWTGADRAPLLLPPGRGLVCCGPGDLVGCAPDLWACARALHLPVLTDPLSGLRFGAAQPGRIARYDALLRNPIAAAALRPDWVLRLGAAPVSKTLGEWLAGVPALLLDPAGRWADPTQDAIAQVIADPGAFFRRLAGAGLVQPDPGWIGAWEVAERRVSGLAGAHLAESPWCEAHLIGELLAVLPAGDGLFCANSLPIRQFDTWSGTRLAPLAVFGNRGVSGIDGQASTLAGLNAAGVPTLGLLGDLSLAHDLSGLLLAGRLRRPLVVLNNGGGRIFDYLLQRGLPGFESLWQTPQALDLADLARTFRLVHRRVSDGEGFSRALAAGLAAPGPRLIEVIIDAEASRAVHLGFWRRVAQADLMTGV